jgi:dTDP-4-amino-4,6-dideoxygalactose transaminase
MDPMINIMKPSMPTEKQLSHYLKRIDRTKVYSNFGPLYSELVDELSVYFCVPPECIVVMSNATLGLMSALSVAKVPDSQKVYLPSWTFAATAGAAKMMVKKRHFVDIDDEWRAIIKPNYRFVLDVLPFGAELIPSRYDNQEFTVIDGAASFDSLKAAGNNLKDNQVLILSLHATKLIGAGEGGVCIATNPEIASEIKSWINFGFNGSRNSDSLGINAKISEYTAAVGLASLKNWETNRKILAEKMEYARKISNDLGLEITESMRKGFVSPYWIVRFETHKIKTRVNEHLQKNQVETRNWWELGCHNMNAYKDFTHENLDQTKLVGRTSLGLPFHTFLTKSEFEKIARLISEVI